VTAYAWLLMCLREYNVVFCAWKHLLCKIQFDLPLVLFVTYLHNLPGEAYVKPRSSLMCGLQNMAGYLLII
jgi:hypothetical protein